MRTKNDFESIAEIKRELKILRLKKDISLELLQGNKNDMENLVQPLTLLRSVLGPFKKILVAYFLKKLFK